MRHLKGGGEPDIYNVPKGRPGPQRTLSLQQEFLLTLMKLKSWDLLMRIWHFDLLSVLVQSAAYSLPGLN